MVKVLNNNDHAITKNEIGMSTHLYREERAMWKAYVSSLGSIDLEFYKNELITFHERRDEFEKNMIRNAQKHTREFNRADIMINLASNFPFQRVRALEILVGQIMHIIEDYYRPVYNPFQHDDDEDDERAYVRSVISDHIFVKKLNERFHIGDPDLDLFLDAFRFATLDRIRNIKLHVGIDDVASSLIKLIDTLIYIQDIIDATGYLDTLMFKLEFDEEHIIQHVVLPYLMSPDLLEPLDLTRYGIEPNPGPYREGNYYQVLRDIDEEPVFMGESKLKRKFDSVSVEDEMDSRYESLLHHQRKSSKKQKKIQINKIIEEEKEDLLDIESNPGPYTTWLSNKLRRNMVWEQMNVLAKSKNKVLSPPVVAGEYPLYHTVDGVVKMTWTDFKWIGGCLIPTEFEEYVMTRREKRRSSMSKMYYENYKRVRAKPGNCTNNDIKAAEILSKLKLCSDDFVMCSDELPCSHCKLSDQTMSDWCIYYAAVVRHEVIPKPDDIWFVNYMLENTHGSRREIYRVFSKVFVIQPQTSIGETVSALHKVATEGVVIQPVEISGNTKEYLNEKVKEVKGMLEEFPSKLADNFANAFNLNSWFKSFEGPMGVGCMMLGAAFVALLLWKFPNNRMIWLLAASFAAYTITKISFPKIKTLVASWLTMSPQSDDKEYVDGVQSSVDIGSMDNYVELAYEAISLGVFGKVMYCSKRKDLDERFCEAAKTSETVAKFAGRCKEWILKCARTICLELGIQFNRDVGPFAKELTELQRIMHSLLERVEKRTSNAIDAEMSRKLQEYTRKHNALELKIQNLKEDAHIRKILQYNLSRLKDVKTLVSENGFSKDGSIEPFSLYLCGAPGTGKTNLTEFLMQKLAISVMDEESVMDFIENPNRVIFSPAVGSPFYDTYLAQQVMYWADIFSSLPPQGQENEATFWINAYGSNNFNLNMAQLSQKGKIHLVASLLYAVGNKFVFDKPYFDKCLSNTSALVRRINSNAWCCVVKPQYAQNNTKPTDFPNLTNINANFWNSVKAKFPKDFDPSVKPAWQPENLASMPDGLCSPLWRKLDLDKAGNGSGKLKLTDEELDYNLNVWYFIEWDWENGAAKPGGRIVEYDEFLEINRDAYVKHMANQTKVQGIKGKFLKDCTKRRLAELSALKGKAQSGEEDLEDFGFEATALRAVKQGEKYKKHMNFLKSVYDSDDEASEIAVSCDNSVHGGVHGSETSSQYSCQMRAQAGSSEDEFLEDDDDYYSVTTQVVDPLELNIADMIPSTEVVFHKPDGAPIPIPICLKDRIDLAAAKTRMRVFKGDVIDYLHEMDNSIDGISDYVRKYYSDCMLAQERIPFESYTPSFQGDPCHPFHAIIDEIPLKDLRAFVNWNLKDDMMIHCLVAKQCCSDAIAAFTLASTTVLRKVTGAFKKLSRKAYRWFNTPLVRSFFDSYAYGYAVIGTLFTSIFAVVKIVDWLYPKAVEETKLLDGQCNLSCKCGHVSLETKNKCVTNSACLHESNCPGHSSEDLIPIGPGFINEIGEAQACMNDNDAGFMTKWKGNIYKIRLHRGAGDGELAQEYTKHVGTMTFLGAHVAFTCAHVQHTLQRLCSVPGYKYYRIGIYAYNVQSTIPTKTYFLKDLEFIPVKGYSDLVIVKVPRSSLHMASCLYDLLLEKDSKIVKDMKALEHVRIVMPHKLKDGSVENEKPKMRFSRKSFPYALTLDMAFGGKGDRQTVADYRIDNVAYIDNETVPGQSGEVGFVIDSNVSKCNPIPLYFHCAGGGGFGYGIVLYKEMFKEFLPLIKPHDIAIKPVEDRMQEISALVTEFDEVRPRTSVDEELGPVSHDFQPEKWMPYHRVIGYTSKLPINMSTSIKRTLLYKPIKEKYGMTRRPATLFSKDSDVSAIARQHYGSNVYQIINIRNVEYVQEKVCSWIIRKSSDIVFTRRLSFEEALLGCPQIHLKQLHASTSCGYMLKVVKEKLGFKGKGKTWIFPNPEELDVDSDLVKVLRRCYDKAIAKLESGDRILNVFLDCLKDELRNHDKAMYPRHFCAADTIYLLVNRSAFGPFAGWIYENRLRTPFCIGMNPYSKEWDILYRLLTEVSDLGIFGDFSKFDKKQVVQLMCFTRRLFERYYGNSDPIGNRIRQLLFEDCLNSIHAVPDGDRVALYEWLHGLSSGHFLTAIINSGSNILSLICCFCDILTQEMGGFNLVREKDLPVDEVLDKTCIKVYGDDNAMTIHESISQINFYSLQDSLKRLWCLDYTDELKGTSGLVPAHRPVKDGNFIARGFNITMLDGELVVLANLRLYSAREAVAHDKKGNPVGTQQKINISVLEHANWGPDIFYDWVWFLEVECRKAGLPLPEITDWDVAVRYLRNSDPPMYSPLSQYVELEYSDFGFADKLDERRPLEIRNLLGLDSGRESFSTKSENESGSSTKNDETSERPTLENKGTAQAGDEDVLTNTTPTPGVVCDTSKTTCFVESESIVSTTYRAQSVPSDLNVRYMSIVDYLGKPVLVGTYDYSSSTTKNANLLTQQVGSLLTGNTYWAHKIEGFNLIKATLVVRLECNAMPFQQGKLLLHYLPCVANFTAAQGNWINRYNITTDSVGNGALLAKYQHPHVEFDIRRTNATMRIPYITPADYYELNSTATPYDWGTFYLDAVVPMGSGGTAGTTDVYVSVYAYFEDVELAAPLVPQTGDETVAKRSTKGRIDREVQESKGPVSGSLTLASKVADSLSDIPSLAPVAKPLAWATAVGAGMASMFGWSKPRLTEKPAIMAGQQGRYMAVSDGIDIAMPLALTSDNCIQVTDRFSLTSEDEMSLNYLLSFPTYMGDITWTTSNAPNTNLYSYTVSPTTLAFGFTETHTHVVGYSVGAPLFYLSNFFEYWHGSMELTLKFIKTQYHSGRIQVTFTPCTITNSITTTNAQMSMREIIDIREQEEVTLVFPWYVPYKYLPLQYAEGMSNVNFGHVDIVVLNELRCPETCSASIPIQVFWKAGPDFEYQVPTAPANNFGVLTPQTGEEEVVNKPICEESIGVANTSRSSMCIGEHFTNLKQLLMRFVMLSNITTGSGTTLEFAFWPWGGGVTTLSTGGTITSGTNYLDIYSLIAPMYAFFRGGVNMEYMAMNENSTDPTNCAFALYVPNLFGKAGLTSSSLQPYANKIFSSKLIANRSLTDSNLQASGGSAAFWPSATTLQADIQNPNIIVRVPYQNKTPISLYIPFDGATAGILGERSAPPGAVALCSVESTVANIFIQRSLADDFQFSFFLNAPPLMTSYTA